jgi:hypothetical protein
MPSVPFEKLIRDFTGRQIGIVRARRKPVEEQPPDECILEWGKESNFDTSQDDGKGGPSVKWPTDQKPKEEEEETEEKDIVYPEVNRETETKRVTNPTDVTQYVDVARTKKIRFKRPDGKIIRFELKNPK